MLSDGRSTDNVWKASGSTESVPDRRRWRPYVARPKWRFKEVAARHRSLLVGWPRKEQYVRYGFISSDYLLVCLFFLHTAPYVSATKTLSVSIDYFCRGYFPYNNWKAILIRLLSVQMLCRNVFLEDKQMLLASVQALNYYTEISYNIIVTTMLILL